MQRLLEPAQLPNSERHGVVSRLVGNTPNVAVRRKTCEHRKSSEKRQMRRGWLDRICLFLRHVADNRQLKRLSLVCLQHQDDPNN